MKLILLLCLFLGGCHKAKDGAYITPVHSYSGWRHPLPVPYPAGLEYRPFRDTQNSRWGRLPERSADAEYGWRRLSGAGKDKTGIRDLPAVIGIEPQYFPVLLKGRFGHADQEQWLLEHTDLNARVMLGRGEDWSEAGIRLVWDEEIKEVRVQDYLNDQYYALSHQPVENGNVFIELVQKDGLTRIWSTGRKIKMGEQTWSLVLDEAAPSGVRLDVWDMQGRLLQSSLLERAQ